VVMLAVNYSAVLIAVNGLQPKELLQSTRNPKAKAVEARQRRRTKACISRSSSLR